MTLIIVFYLTCNQETLSLSSVNHLPDLVPPALLVPLRINVRDIVTSYFALRRPKGSARSAIIILPTV